MNATIKYNSSSITKQFDNAPTFAEVAADTAIKAALGFGDNVKAMVGGIEQPMCNQIPENALVTFENRANAKAS